MRILLLCDRSFATREHAMLRRLEVGLVDDGCRVVRAFPLGSFDEPTTALTAAVPYNDSPWRRWALTPARAIERALADVASLTADPEESPVDVIHAFGDGCWPIARSLALTLGADLALEVWSRQALSLVSHYEKHTAALEEMELGAAWLGPDERMRQAVEQTAKRWPVYSSRWGVHVPSNERSEVTALDSLCILASGLDPGALANLLTGCALALRDREKPMIFLDSAAVDRSPAVWRHARSLGLLPRLTLLPDMEARRQLVLRAGALILPECRGEHRTITLEAMAAGMVIVARPDPLIEATSDPSRAILVEDPTESTWQRAITSILDPKDAAASLGEEAHRYIREHRLAHLQVRATADAYARFLSDRPFPMSPV